MIVFTRDLTLLSEGGGDVLFLTDRVREIVRASGVTNGFVFIFYRHTTGAVLLVEYEAGLLADFLAALEQIAPIAADYLHHRRGHDLNGAAHVRTALLSVSASVPVVAGDLALGAWQEVVAVDFDHGQKERSLLVQVMGE